MAEPSNGPTGWGRIRRGLVALGATALAAFAVSALSAGAAQAQTEDVTFTFDNVVGNLGTLTGGQLIDPAVDPPATMSGTIETATGDFTIQPADFFFPEKTFEDVQPSIDATVKFSTDTPISGNLDQTTGDASWDLSLDAHIVLSGAIAADCNVSNAPLTLETSGTLPGTPDRNAAPFAPPSGDGAVVELWDGLPAAVGTPQPICDIVSGTIGGAGGVWMAGTALVGPPGPEPFHLELNHGELKLGTQPVLEFLSDAEPATFDGLIDPATGEFTVPVDGVVLPPAQVTTPVAATISTEVLEPVTGTFDETTGELEMSMLVDSITTVPALGATCTFHDFQWSFSTATTTPFEGAPFADGLDGAGAMVTAWDDLPPVDPNAEPCLTVRTLGMGPGGFLLGRELGPPPAPELALSVKPNSRTVKQGKGATFTTTVRNTGDANATGVRVCMTAPRKAVKPAKKCANVGMLAAGELEKTRFVVRAKRNAKPRSYTLRFRATGTGGPDNATATLKVKRR
jgi:NPCBM-associated, NEW3 domain of alpha-galactosidase